MINLRKLSSYEDGDILSSSYEINGEGKETLVDALTAIDADTKVIDIEPSMLMISSIIRRTTGGVETYVIAPDGIANQTLFSGTEGVQKTEMPSDALKQLGVSSDTLAEIFEEGHFLIDGRDDLVLCPCRGFTTLLSKRLGAGKLTSGLNVARDAYLATIMSSYDGRVSIMGRQKEGTKSLKALSVFSDKYCFNKQYEIFEKVAGAFSKRMEVSHWVITHGFTSINFEVFAFADYKVCVTLQFSQTGECSLMLFPSIEWADHSECLGTPVAMPATASNFEKDPQLRGFVNKFEEKYMKEIDVLHDLLLQADKKRVEKTPLLYFKKLFSKLHIRAALGNRKAKGFAEAFTGTNYSGKALSKMTYADVIGQFIKAPAIVKEVYPGVYDMVQDSLDTSLEVAEALGVAQEEGDENV